jgi:signal transduction histidine kinase
MKTGEDSRHRFRVPTVRYGSAVAVALAAVFLRWLLDPILGERIPYLTVYPAIMIVAVMLGAGPAMATTLLSLVLIEFLFLDFGGTMSMVSFGVRGLILILTSFYVGRVGEGLRRVRVRAEAEAEAARQAEENLKRAHSELEERIQERTAALSKAVVALQGEIEQRESLEETLRTSEQRVRFFAAQCLTAQEVERKRIAGELHDSLASTLVAAKYRLEKTLGQMKSGMVPGDSLQDVVAILGGLNKEVRRIMVDLRPSVLDDLGLLPALNWFCREFEKTYGHIRVEKRTELAENELAEAIKTPLFRLTQEALTNVAKHSGASLVTVSLGKVDGRIVLIIRDNGRGFAPEKVIRGLGLTTMKERTELSGGEYCLESVPGQGTALYASWPVED